MPAALAVDDIEGFGRAPGALGVLIHRRRDAQHRVDDRPCGFNLILTCEQGGIATERITMLVVSHEMGFARQVAHRMIFMAEGQILEINEPKDFFDHPQHERTRLFLQQILR